MGNVSCTGNNRIEFQSGDIIGYHHGSPVRYRLWNIVNGSYTAYRRTGKDTPLSSFNINSASDHLNEQPLIQIMYGKIYCMYCYAHFIQVLAILYM